MRPTVSVWIAAVSLLAGLTVDIAGSSRPRYGGTLRMEMVAALSTLDPAEIPSDPAAMAAATQLIPLVFETLVRVDDSGNVVPCLASSWAHDTARKRWVFHIRPNVKLHTGVTWMPPGDAIEVPDDKPIDQLLHEMAQPWKSIAVHESDGSLSGTGPFRIVRWDGRKSATLAAHDGYWRGRPFLDQIEIQMSREPREQGSDFQLGKTDVIDRPVGSGNTRPDQVIALVFDNPKVSSTIREAVSLAIDRTVIRHVLLKDRGEISGALLPQWISGYSFLFSAKGDMGRARQLATGGAQLSFAYDRQDPVLRSIAERIAVNTQEAGITLRATTSAPDVHLLILPITSKDERSTLADLSVILKSRLITGATYDTEKALIGDFHVIPLFHTSRGWMTSARIENWPDLPNVWMRQP